MRKLAQPEMDLDIEDFDALRQYLMRQPNAGEPVSFRKLTGGVSSRVVQVTWANGHGWVIKQALAKLRVAADWYSSPERIAVEADALRWMNRLAPQGTTPCFTLEDKANYLLAMGAIPDGHENWKSVLLSGRMVAAQFEQFGLLLGTIHRQSANPSLKLCKVFANTAHFESLRLAPYYGHAAQNTPLARGFLDALTRETLAHKLCLVHGDFSPKNTLFYEGKLILLDYEVAHFGDPAFDVGFALTHLLSKAHHLVQIRKKLAESAILFWSVYRQEVATLDWNEFEPRIVRHLLGCLLARVDGKSPLEYLRPEEAQRQREVTLLLMQKPPAGVTNFISQFVQLIESHA